MRLISALGVLFLGFSTSLGAQEAAVGTRAGAWGAEVSFDVDSPEMSGALLRFRSDRSAWIFGLNASFSQRKAEQDGLSLGDADLTSVGMRLGLRSYRSPESAVRPVVGAGITGTYSDTQGLSKFWAAGAYGEFGVVRFFGPSLNIGAVADVQLRRGETTSGFDRKVVETRIGFDGIRLNATVIF